jgi:hypothetical protein
MTLDPQLSEDVEDVVVAAVLGVEVVGDVDHVGARR